jgi:hypothetical protein
VRAVLLWIFWIVLPYLLASAVTSVHKKLAAAGDPWAEAVRIGNELTNTIKKALEENEE